jgi:hypothetical protein
MVGDRTGPGVIVAIADLKSGDPTQAVAMPPWSAMNS